MTELICFGVLIAVLYVVVLLANWNNEDPPWHQE